MIQLQENNWMVGWTDRQTDPISTLPTTTVGPFKNYLPFNTSYTNFLKSISKYYIYYHNKMVLHILVHYLSIEFNLKVFYH